MMRKLIGLFFIVCLTASVHGQWSTLGNSIYTSSNEIQFNYSNNPTSTIWLNKNNQGPGTRGHYYIKAFDYWGAYLHFVGTGDQDNERLNVTFDGKVGIGTTDPLANLHINNGDQTYGAILAQANESNFQLYTKTLTTQPTSVESFRLGLKYGTDENNGFISFYRGGSTNGGFLGFSTNGTERVRIANNGKVGVGTTQSGSWGAKLVINNKEDFSKIIQLGAEGPTTWFMGIGDDSGTYFHIGENSSKRLIINKSSGNVGIGTNSPTPSAKLEISSGRNGFLVNGSMGGDNFTDYQSAFTFTDLGILESGIKINKKNGGGNFDLFKAFYNSNELFVIRSNGRVGIGASEPTAKLHVSGDILADEIRVEDIAASNLNLNGTLAANNITVKANGNTADFVFSDDYTLKSLTEVENYIKTHKHLPDIPSAEAMEKQGVNLAEMNKLLLQKVEELTLYTISQEEKLTAKDNRITKLEEDRKRDTEDRKKETEELKEKSQKLEERLAKLEALLMK